MEAFFEKFAKVPLLQKVLGLVVVCLLMVLVFYMFVLSPIKDTQTNLQNEIGALESDLIEKKKMVGNISQYKREVEKLNQNLQRALKLLPNTPEIPSLLQKISSLAKKSGLEIKTFVPGNENPQDFYAKVPVNLELLGSYNEIVNFFDAVSKLSRIVNINNYKFALQSDKKAPGQTRKRVLSASCTATTFRFIGGK